MVLIFSLLYGSIFKHGIERFHAYFKGSDIITFQLLNDKLHPTDFYKIDHILEETIVSSVRNTYNASLHTFGLMNDVMI